jgi:hypothetical protein
MVLTSLFPELPIAPTISSQLMKEKIVVAENVARISPRATLRIWIISAEIATQIKALDEGFSRRVQNVGPDAKGTRQSRLKPGNAAGRSGSRTTSGSTSSRRVERESNEKILQVKQDGAVLISK